MAADYILLEDGFHLEIEDGTGDLILESSTVGAAFIAFPHPRGESAGMHKLTGGINE